MASQEVETIIKSILIAIVVEIFLNVGFIAPASVPFLINGQLNTALFNGAYLIPAIGIIIVATAYDYLFSSKIHYAENIIGAFVLEFYVVTANPSPIFISLNGVFAILSMVFIMYVVSSIARYIFEGNKINIKGIK